MPWFVDLALMLAASVLAALMVAVAVGSSSVRSRRRL
jgi:hypothetical protein